jgi:hypothetical protein
MKNLPHKVLQRLQRRYPERVMGFYTAHEVRECLGTLMGVSCALQL